MRMVNFPIKHLRRFSKNAKINADFDQLLECVASKFWLKYTVQLKQNYTNQHVMNLSTNIFEVTS